MKVYIITYVYGDRTDIFASGVDSVYNSKSVAEGIMEIKQNHANETYCASSAYVDYKLVEEELVY